MLKPEFILTWLVQSKGTTSSESSRTVVFVMASYFVSVKIPVIDFYNRI